MSGWYICKLTSNKNRVPLYCAIIVDVSEDDGEDGRMVD